jgi:hypothetical protein
MKSPINASRRKAAISSAGTAATAPEPALSAVNNHSDYELSDYDKEGISLGLILIRYKKEETSSEKLESFNRTVHSLKVALSIDSPTLPGGIIKEVIVVDDGTAGLSVKDKVMLSTNFPSFHFVFESSRSRRSSKKDSSWDKLNALNTLIKISQSRYLLLVPSDMVALSFPYLPRSLSSIYKRFRENIKLRRSVTSFSHADSSFPLMLRLALQLLNGYTNVSCGARVEGFSVSDPPQSSDSNCDDQKVYRQSAHVVLLNSFLPKHSLNMDVMDEEKLNKQQCSYFDALGSGVSLSNPLASGKFYLTEKCATDNSNYFDKYTKIYDTAVSHQTSEDFELVKTGIPHCVCSVANQTYIRESTYFGGYVDEDVKDICLRHKQGMAAPFLKNMDTVVNDTYRDFSCLLALFNKDALNAMKIPQEDVSYLMMLKTMYLQPSLWDADAVSFVIQGMEREYIFNYGNDLDRKNLTFSKRFRHNRDKVAKQAKVSKNSHRKRSLVKMSDRVDALYHARGEVVFDRLNSFEYQNHDVDVDGNTSGVVQASSCICQYLNVTLDVAMDMDNVFHCYEQNKNTGKVRKNCSPQSIISHSERFVHRILSSGVRIAYLSGQMFKAN